MSTSRNETDDSVPPGAQVLDKDDQAKIRRLLKSKTLEHVSLGLSLLDSLGATPSDQEAVFTPAAIKFTRRLANEWLQGGDQTRRDYLVYHGVMVRPWYLASHRAAVGDASPFLQLVAIPAGEFVMGSPAGNRLAGHPLPVTVRIARPFQLGRTVVTQAQWQAVMGTEPWRHTRHKNLPQNQCGDRFPAVYVSWDDAMLFCQMLTDMEQQAGRLTTAQAYRLPTEAEWEYACRAGTTTAYSFGDDSRMLGEFGWFCNNSEGRLHEVALKKPNGWGLFDMHGNVWEWCADWYAENLGGGVDPTGPSTGSQRVGRGGLWGYVASYCCSAHRASFDPGHRCGLYGFRVVLAE